MCLSPNIPKATAPVVPESVKRVAKDQRRVVSDNTAAAAAASTATNKTAGLATAPSGTQKKALLGA